MALKVDSTTIWDNSANLPLTTTSVTNIVRSLAVTTVGDGTYAYGGGTAYCDVASFNGSTGALSLRFNTNCACVCVCVCACDCACE